MDLHLLRQPNAPVKKLVGTHGLKTIMEELWEMAQHDLADLAFEAAMQIEAKDVATYAAQVVRSSGSYAPKAKERAHAFLESQNKSSQSETEQSGSGWFLEYNDNSKNPCPVHRSLSRQRIRLKAMTETSALEEVRMHILTIPFTRHTPCRDYTLVQVIPLRF